MSVPHLSHELIQLGTHSNQSTWTCLQRRTQIHSCLSVSEWGWLYFSEMQQWICRSDTWAYNSFSKLDKPCTYGWITLKRPSSVVLNYGKEKKARSQCIPVEAFPDPLLKQSCVCLPCVTAGRWVWWSQMKWDDCLLSKSIGGRGFLLSLLRTKIIVIIFLKNKFRAYMSENNEKWPSEFPKPCGDVVKLHVLSNLQCTTKMCTVVIIIN